MPLRKEDWVQRLSRIEKQGDSGVLAARRARRWLESELPFVRPDEVRRLVELGPDDLIIDSFRRDLPFGTGGQRGPMGIGPNRVNLHTAAQTIVGHATFLFETHGGGGLSVVVANDTRIFADIAGTYGFMTADWSLLGTSSRSLALFACAIYRACGVTPYLTEPDSDSAFLPTPELSFAIRRLDAAGGLNVSASHNHPDDNGLKVYTPDGGQYCPPLDEALAKTVATADIPPELERDVRRQAPPEPIPDSVHRAYLDLYLKSDLVPPDSGGRDSTPIVYTPMGGTGLASVGEVLVESGYEIRTPPDHGPDGTFAAIPLRSPNPEIPGVAQPAIDYAEECGARLVISTDPDADRLGVEVKTAQDEWKHLTGNQIAAIVSYYLVADPAGPRRAGELITTVATSQVVRAIGALSAGVRVKDDLLIGFKFIAQHLDEVRRSAGELAFAAEESHGYLTSDELRDKDAASAAPVIAHLHVLETSRGRDLWSYLMDVHDTVGVHVEFGRSLVFPGAQGAAKIDTMMESLRASPPAHIGDEPVSDVRDRLSADYGGIRSEGERSARNLLEVESSSYRVVVRPSGTEAKLKYYFNFRERERGEGSAAERYAALEKHVKAACDDFYRDLARRVGLDLSQEAIDLPDVLPVEEKVRRTAGA